MNNFINKSEIITRRAAASFFNLEMFAYRFLQRATDVAQSQTKKSKISHNCTDIHFYLYNIKCFKGKDPTVI